jgi:hypothetical protein
MDLRDLIDRVELGVRYQSIDVCSVLVTSMGFESRWPPRWSRSQSLG